jgi:hypothetical protein
MKAQELRIGNLVNWITSDGRDKFLLPVCQINSGEFVHLRAPGGGIIEGTTTNLEGVLLTEEWLLRFVFDKLNHDMVFYDKKIKRGDCNTFALRIWFNKHWNVGNGMDGGIDFPIEFVYQLQNLHFALTGEELEIKS